MVPSFSAVSLGRKGHMAIMMALKKVMALVKAQYFGCKVNECASEVRYRDMVWLVRGMVSLVNRRACRLF